MKRVYFDHNASSPVHPEARTAALWALEQGFGNPSSGHWYGQEARGVVEDARVKVARLINAKPSEIIFTSGGTEGDNMAIRGLVPNGSGRSHIITTAVEHPAVLKTCRHLCASIDAEVTYIPVDDFGIPDPEDIRKAIRTDTALITVMYANNETGNIFPVHDISAIAREHGIPFHTDAVQAVGKLALDVEELGVDMLTASGHKFNAPKGIGFQYVREGLSLRPLITGGQQDGGLRGGTENVTGIAGLGEACRVAFTEIGQRKETVGALRERLEEGILRDIPETVLNGHPELRVYNTANISFRYIEGDALADLLNTQGIAVSTGSACASGSTEPSHVLQAMGLEPLRARGALRFSLGRGNTEEDVDYCLDILRKAVNSLLEMSPFYRKKV